MGVEVLGFKITEDFKVLGLVREIMAEFLGTFYLIFIGCGGMLVIRYLNAQWW